VTFFFCLYLYPFFGFLVCMLFFSGRNHIYCLTVSVTYVHVHTYIPKKEICFHSLTHTLSLLSETLLSFFHWLIYIDTRSGETVCFVLFMHARTRTCLFHLSVIVIYFPSFPSPSERGGEGLLCLDNEWIEYRIKFLEGGRSNFHWRWRGPG